MNIYIDESGSINNKNSYSRYFVICLLKTDNTRQLQRLYKRFVANNIDRLRELDQDKVDNAAGRILKQGGKMFINGKFQELKGSQFDRKMKEDFLEFFSRKPCFEIYYIKIDNMLLSDNFCANTARAFNYTIKLALTYFFQTKKLPEENCNLQLDERNEKPEAKYFLENYLNTEISLGYNLDCKFCVKYFDSSNNKLVQLADVFSNVMYSNLKTGAYQSWLNELQAIGILKYIFEFPQRKLDNNGEE